MGHVKWTTVKQKKALAGSTVVFELYSDMKEQDVLHAHNTSVNAIEARDGAAATASINVAGRYFKATGSSKRNKGEVFRAGVGERLAVARALRNLARELEKGIH